jgi:hypothetical protein
MFISLQAVIVPSQDAQKSCRCDEHYRIVNQKLDLILDAVRSMGSNPRTPSINENAQCLSFPPIEDEKKFLELEQELMRHYNNPTTSSSEFKSKRIDMVKLYN